MSKALSFPLAYAFAHCDFHEIPYQYIMIFNGYHTSKLTDTVPVHCDLEQTPGGPAGPGAPGKP